MQGSSSSASAPAPTTRSGAAPAPTTRLGELTKFMPLIFVVVTIGLLYMMYVFLHCFRMLQFEVPDGAADQLMVWKGKVELYLFHILTGLVVYCFVRCIYTHPGTIPDGGGWELRTDLEDEQKEAASVLREKKHTGEQRHCKWCLKYKPDRCHHCRICNICILRMDHHCPWVYNCIGFRNHKYFFLLLIYSALNLILVDVTMFDSVWWSTRTDVSITVMIALVFGETLATFLMVLLISFLSFHIWLMSKAMTTVEFCEKSLKKASYDSSAYSQGLYANICASLGPHPALWLLPVSLPEGDGLNYAAKGGSSGNEAPGRSLLDNAAATGSGGAAPLFRGASVSSGASGGGGYRARRQAAEAAEKGESDGPPPAIAG